MNDSGKKLFGLSPEHKQRLIARMRNRSQAGQEGQRPDKPGVTGLSADIPREFYTIEDLPGLKQLQIQATAA